MATNSITLDVILKDIVKTANDLKDTYVNNLKKVSESAFKKSAERVINDMLEKKHTDMWKYGDDDKTKAQIEAVNKKIKEAVNDAYTAYVEKYNTEKLKKTKAEEQAKKAAAITIDFDPYIENGGTIKAVSYMDKAVANTIDKKTGKNVVQKKQQLSVYHATNNAYSGCDIVCTVDFPTTTGKSVSTTFGTLQTISYSIHQEKMPVRVLGNMNAKDWVFGPRTIAGSLVFAVLNKHWLVDIYDQLYENAEMKGWHFVTDEIPPFNITISFANEYGFDSRMAIYGVRLINEGQTMSVNDLYIENTYQFVANDINYMDSLSSYQKGESKIASSPGIFNVETASSRNRGKNKELIAASDKGDNASSQVNKTLEAAKKNLEFTQETWNKYLVRNSYDLGATKRIALEDLSTIYNAYLADTQFTSTSGNKESLEQYYKTSVGNVEKFANATLEGAPLTKEEADADHPKIIDLMLKYDESKWSSYKKQADNTKEAYGLYKLELDNALEKAKQRLETKLFSEKDLVYANFKYKETLGILDGKLLKEG